MSCPAAWARGPSEPGHAAVDEARVPLEAGIGSETEALHHTRAEAFEEPVGAVDQIEHQRNSVRVLQIHPDAAPSSREEIAGGVRSEGVGARTHHADHLGAHVRKHHGAVGAGPDACDLDQLDSFQRSHASVSVGLRSGRRRG